MDIFLTKRHFQKGNKVSDSNTLSVAIQFGEFVIALVFGLIAVMFALIKLSQKK